MLFWLLNQHEVARCPSFPQTQHLVVEVDEVDFPLSFVVVVLVTLVVLALAGVVCHSSRWGLFLLLFLFVVVDVVVVGCNSCCSGCSCSSWLL